MLDFSDAALYALQNEVRGDLSNYRFRHIAEVQNTILRLGRLYLPDLIPELRAAALLHDFTKEFSKEEHERIFASHGILLTPSERLSPKLYHARTAALLIPERFPHLASNRIVDAVRYHTTGREGMTLFEMLLYLADYIDDSRTFDDCVALRRAFWDASPASMDEDARLAHLYRILIRSADMTVRALLDEGAPISDDTIRMRNDLIARLAQKNT
ncbi:MAG: bis(5'-nucleosyl)-tetraphosphatase (symmetrical) YqeK [Clostridia bacterium]|nr:bis(5'-nucleosyl)-tetraphosphatase (symmetrical) YqeK [Clostridia bacterium]